ncbi:hypothetical protein Tco_0958962 [Tanacetum coccineum]
MSLHGCWVPVLSIRLQAIGVLICQDSAAYSVSDGLKRIIDSDAFNEYSWLCARSLKQRSSAIGYNSKKDTDLDAFDMCSELCDMIAIVDSPREFTLFLEEGKSVRKQPASAIGLPDSYIRRLEVPSTGPKTGCLIRIARRRLTAIESDTSIKVLKALKAVIGHLRKFLVDRSVLPLFEKTHNPQEQQVDGHHEADKPMMRLLLNTRAQVVLIMHFQ